MIYRSLTLVLLLCAIAPPAPAATAAEPEDHWAFGAGLYVPATSTAVVQLAPGTGPGPMGPLPQQVRLSAGAYATAHQPRLALGFEARLAEGWWLPVSADLSWDDFEAGEGPVGAVDTNSQGASLSVGLRRMWTAGAVRPSLHVALGMGYSRFTQDREGWDPSVGFSTTGNLGGAVDVPLYGPLWLRGRIDLLSAQRTRYDESSPHLSVWAMTGTHLSIWTRF